MEESKKKLYHIHKLNNNDEIWKVGNELEFGKEKNNFTKTAFEFEYKIMLENAYYPYLNVYDYYGSRQAISDLLNLLPASKSFINEYQILVRELGMEEIRKEEFSLLPSRRNCIWLCRENQIDFWKKFLGDDIEIYELEIFNSVFKTRNALIPLPSDSYKQILKKSKQYWSYNSTVENEDDEYLYTGKLKIVGKVN